MEEMSCEFVQLCVNLDYRNCRFFSLLAYAQWDFSGPLHRRPADCINYFISSIKDTKNDTKRQQKQRRIRGNSVELHHWISLLRWLVPVSFCFVLFYYASDHTYTKRFCTHECVQTKSKKNGNNIHTMHKQLHFSIAVASAGRLSMQQTILYRLSRMQVAEACIKLSIESSDLSVLKQCVEKENNYGLWSASSCWMWLNAHDKR